MQLLLAARSYRPPQRREVSMRRQSFLGRRRANTNDSGAQSTGAASDTSAASSTGTSPDTKDKDGGLRARRLSWGRAPQVDVSAAPGGADHGPSGQPT